MKTSATNKKIRLLMTGIRTNSLIPRPEFQRRLVWSNRHRVAFLETVLMGLPFPEIYIAAGEVDPDTGEGTEMLVDGQQRVTTLYQYFTGSNELRLGNTIRPYAELKKEEKLAFLEYEVVVRDLGNKSIEEIKDIFRRINSTKYSLNAMEIHNARFDGEMKSFGEEISQHAFFDNHRVFKTTEVRRMGDLTFSLILIITVTSTYFNRDSELEEFLEKYNDELECKEDINHDLNIVFRFVDDCKLADDSRAWKKADLLTLLVEVHRLLIKEQIQLDAAKAGRLLKRFYTQVDCVASGGDGPDEVRRYYKAAIQATNDRSSRMARGEVLLNILRKAAKKSPRKPK